MSRNAPPRGNLRSLKRAPVNTSETPRRATTPLGGGPLSIRQSTPNGARIPALCTPPTPDPTSRPMPLNLPAALR
eukprot:11185057-Lingulodinium_polyedra.AAC.1